MKRLFQAYADWLGVDLCFQNFADEMATFPAFYEFLLISGPAATPAGAVGLKRLDAERCEMKRLYVPPAFRGKGVARRLCEQLISGARERSYKLMTLDTLERLQPAIALYEQLGFSRCAPYYDNPEEDVVYMELAL